MSFLTDAILSLPPFTCDSETPPDHVGHQIAAFYGKLADARPPVSSLWHHIAVSTNMEVTSPFYTAGEDIACALDRGIGTGLSYGYHNTVHYLETLFNTFYLLKRQALDPDHFSLSAVDQQKLLLTALLHDFDYPADMPMNEDGSPMPYYRELRSIAKAAPYLDNHGLSAKDMDEITLLVVATDISPAAYAGQCIRAIHAFHVEQGKRPILPTLWEPLRPLLDDARLTRMAAILLDADVIASAGLSPTQHQIQRFRLGTEWKKQMGPNDTLFFIDHLLGGKFISPEASFFQPNMNRIRQVAKEEILDQ